MRIIGAFILLFAIYQGYWAFRLRPYHPPKGILVRTEPKQENLDQALAPITHGKFDLKRLAKFQITARLISRERYRFDHGANLSPLDLCVAWGKMSSTDILSELRFDQIGRLCTYSWEIAPPLPEDMLARSMANIHTIPADSQIRDILFSLRPGQVIYLEGFLVEASDNSGSTWKSSLTRDDRGLGACELMYVTKAWSVAI